MNETKSKFARGDSVVLYGLIFADDDSGQVGSYAIFGKVVDTVLFPDNDEPWVTVRNEITGREITELESFVYRIGD